MNFYEGRKIYYDKKGYAIVWMGGKNCKVHILEWEKYNGEKPRGFEIHHKDENKKNYHISNLEILTHSDHQRIHAGWVKVDGKWISKPCNHCRKILPLDSFYNRRGLTPTAMCKPCHVKHTEKWKMENLDRVKEIKRRSHQRIKTRRDRVMKNA